MTNQTATFLTALCALLLFSCNPDCESLRGLGVAFSLNPTGTEDMLGCPGSEMLIRANPPSSLAGRRIYFGEAEAETRFLDGYGLITTIPNVGAGFTDIRVEDPDCGERDFVSLNFEVVDPSFFNNQNLDYVFPPPAEIIVPTFSPPFPPSIENAWLSPNNLDYCLWFKFLKDANGDCTIYLDPEESREQCFGDCDPTIDSLYKSNPVSGIIDADNNFIHFRIDRTGIGGGIEELEGIFIHPDDTKKYNEWTTGNEPLLEVNGLPINVKREHMMLLTSSKTGRTLLIYQQGLNVPIATIDCP